MHASLDHPNGIGSSPSDNACEGSRGEMHVTVFVAVIEVFRDDLLPVSVREEVDGSCWDDANEGWAEPFEEGAG